MPWLSREQCQERLISFCGQRVSTAKGEEKSPEEGEVPLARGPRSTSLSLDPDRKPCLGSASPPSATAPYMFSGSSVTPKLPNRVCFATGTVLGAMHTEGHEAG